MSTNAPGAGPPPAATSADFKGSLDEEAQLQAKLDQMRAARGVTAPHMETVAAAQFPTGNSDSLNQELLKQLKRMQQRLDDLEKVTVPMEAKAIPYTHWVGGVEKVAEIIQPGQPGYPEKDPPKDVDGNLLPWMETGQHRV